MSHLLPGVVVPDTYNSFGSPGFLEQFCENLL